jgi:type IV fimbrial biogenesis protein FimT
MCRTQGFTLPEMLAVLLILGVLLTIGIPSMQELSARTRADSAIFQLRGMLGLARQSAITLNRDVTVCGTLDGTRCSAEWREQPALLFADINANRVLDADDRLIQVSDATRLAGVRWRGSGGRPYLRYRADGGVREFGHFLYCPDDGDLRFSRQLVVSATGRPRLAKDTDGDGVIDNGSTAPACSG